MRRPISNDVSSPWGELKRTGESGAPPVHTGTDPEPGGGIQAWTESCCLPHYNQKETTAMIVSPLSFFAILSAEGWGSCEDPSSPVPPCTSGWRTVRLQRQKKHKTWTGELLLCRFSSDPRRWKQLWYRFTSYVSKWHLILDYLWMKLS